MESVIVKPAEENVQIAPLEVELTEKSIVELSIEDLSHVAGGPFVLNR